MKRTLTMPLPPGVHSAPDSLSAAGKKIYTKMAADMFSAGVKLQLRDSEVLAGYAEAVDQAVVAGKALRKDGLIIQRGRGIRANPAFDVSNRAWLRALRFARQLGATPLSRAKMGRRARMRGVGDR